MVEQQHEEEELAIPKYRVWDVKMVGGFSLKKELNILQNYILNFLYWVCSRCQSGESW